MQAETTTYFVVWWVLFEYSSFDHFPNSQPVHTAASWNISHTRMVLYGGTLGFYLRFLKYHFAIVMTLTELQIETSKIEQTLTDKAF